MRIYNYAMFRAPKPIDTAEKEALLVANGDERNSANRVCWSAQEALERQLRSAFANKGWTLTRAHAYDPKLGHGFIESQKQGDAIFDRIPKDATVVVAEAVWQYSNQVAYRLWEHEGPILIASNFDGTWPGLVGALGLESCLTKYKYRPDQKGHSILWSSEEFTDTDSQKRLKEFLEKGRITYDTSHAKPLSEVDRTEYEDAENFGRYLGRYIRNKRARLGVFDPLCMGMLNAAFDEEVLVDTGISVRRLNQSDLYAEMQTISPEQGLHHIQQLEKWGMKVDRPKHPDTKTSRIYVTDGQLAEQGQLYEALVRFAYKEGLDCVGIPYQLGLARLCVSSDLPEGMMNSLKRPAVRYEGRTLFKGEPVPCANEADMGCGVDQIMSKYILNGMHLSPETTLHDLRWGDRYKGQYRDRPDIDVDAFVWAFELSGNTPAEHVEGGWSGVTAVRQPYMYFKKGGAAMKAICKPGEIIWSRVYIDEGELCMDIGRGGVLALPYEETERRWNATTKQWPIMHAVTYDVSRDQMMAEHKSNHIKVMYAPDAIRANEVMFALAGMADGMGIKVNICGTYDIKDSLQYKLGQGLPLRYI
ncbi:MAG: fucose isomerase [Candidatus Aenigmarchaeota archaeon]|nr:fucose isomerase [Candidatus Aenigmarchaeota archaeon]